MAAARIKAKWPAIAGLIAFLGIAAWIYLSGQKSVPRHSPSLVQSLQDKDIESAFGMTAELEPGMLLRMGTLDVVAPAKDAFENPGLLHIEVKDDWIATGSYEDDIEGQGGVETDVLNYFGLDGSKQKLTSEHVSKVAATVVGVQALSLSENDILKAGIKKEFAERLLSDKAVVVVQSVIRAKTLTLQFQDKDSKSATGEIPQAAIPASISTSASTSSKGGEVYSQAVLGFKQCLWLNPADLTAATADKVADNVSAKGYAATTSKSGLLIHTTRATAPAIIQVAREAVAVDLSAASHLPQPEVDATKEREAVALRKLPVRRTPVPGVVLRKRIDELH